MNYFRRFIFLSAALALAVLWAGRFEGGTAWAARSLAVLAGAALAAWWAVRPWKEMTAAARRVQEGDLSARLDDVTPGDLKDPAAAFNAMTGRLAELRVLSEERESRFQAVLAAGGRAIVLMDREGRILLAGPATKTIFPRFREDAMVASLGVPGLSQLVEEAIQSREPQTATLSESEAGRGRVFDARTVPLEDGGTVVILDEMTTEARLDRVKADLVANVSHELRTPLTAMAILLDTLDARDLTPDQRSDFEARLRRQHGRMQALVEDLLSLSRLEGRKVELHREPVVLEPLVTELFAALAPQAEAGRVALSKEISGGLALEADRPLLEMALKNLLDNAVRYNRPGGRVTVRARAAEAWLHLEVEDSGEGIPAPHLDRIFERFYRVDPHRSREKGGTGLGLAIVKHAATQLGGKVSVESQVGKGTTFRLSLPLATRGPSGDALPTETSGQALGRETSPGEGRPS